MNNKNVLLINDTSNGYHWGCYGTSTKIKEKIIENGAKNLKCRTVEQTHATKSVPENVADFEATFDTFKENNIDLIEDIESADCIIINGEGTIHHFHNGPRALLYIMYISKKMFNKKVFVINHSCFPSTDDKNVLDFYETCYKCCDCVAVREGISFDIVKNKLHNDNVILAFDSLPLKIKDIYKNIPEFNSAKKYICLSGAVNFDYSKIKYIIKYLNIFYKHYDLIFLTGSVKGMCDDNDIKVYQVMLKYNPNIKLVEAKSLEEWCSVIKSSAFLLSGRYHYTIGAMALGTKSIQFESNTKKITGIREMFNLSRAIQYKPKLLFKLKLIYELITVRFKKQPNLLDKICSFSNNNYKWSKRE